MVITSQHLTGNFTSSILDALSAIRRLALTIDIMDMVMTFIAVIIVVRDGHRSVRGVKTLILKQFVEKLRNGGNQYWHPECC